MRRERCGMVTVGVDPWIVWSLLVLVLLLVGLGVWKVVKFLWALIA
jgi:hypothetical protein